MNSMRRVAFLLTLFNTCFLVFSQASAPMVCEYGFTYEISMQKNWGYLQPVVTSVTPNSSADAAGLRINDIIETINGKNTAGENIGTITDWLQNSDIQTQLTISNLRGMRQTRTVEKICRLNNSLSEKDLASVYAFYSLEDVQTNAFSCPFKTTVNPESNLLLYSSFGFSSWDPNNQAGAAVIRRSLEEKGLKYADRNPDLLVQISSSIIPNPNFQSSPRADKFPVAYRYNVQTQAMEKVPIYYNPLIHTNQARFFLKLGIKLIDNKKNKNTVVWECVADELLQSDYSIDDYAKFHVPLMFMQYPYPKTSEIAQFYYGRSRYNYTGIHYNIDNLKEIAEVDPSSPAAKAGIEAGDIVEKINGIKFINNAKSASSNYKQFIYKTLPLRDPTTQFTNAEGFTQCMYWNKMNYSLIQDEFKKPQFSTVFSYLFYFAPYINLSGTNIVTFSIIRNNRREDIRVIKPLIISEKIFENR